jgi:hypothetical protein
MTTSVTLARGTPVRIVPNPKHTWTGMAGRAGTYIEPHPWLGNTSLIDMRPGMATVHNDDIEVIA